MAEHRKKVTMVGRTINDLVTPCFLIDKSRYIQNSLDMRNKCQQLGIQLRAQTKTHKTVEGAVLQTGGTKRCIVVSTLDEAEMYVDNGFDDVLFGYPMGPQHVQRCQALVSSIESFHVMIDSIDMATWLANNPPAPTTKWSVFIKVDCGNMRAGVWWQTDEGEQLATLLHNGSHTILQGIYSHCGNSYKQPSGVTTVRDETLSRLNDLAQRIRKQGMPCNHVGTGSTPSCSHPVGTIAKAHGLTEMHPGNYVFYDAQQLSLGTCKEDNVAVRVGTRVIGHYPRRNQILIDAGFLALTKQGMGCLATGCAVVQGHPNFKLVDMTQEIGKLEPIEGTLDTSKYPVGSLLFLYPYHSCATAAMYPVYYVHDNNGIIIEQWYPTRGW